MPAESISLPADRNYNPPAARAFSPSALLPAVLENFDAVCARIGWSRALEPHLPQERIYRCAHCRTTVQYLQKDTPWNSYRSYHREVCSDAWACPHCADKAYRQRLDKAIAHMTAVLGQGVSIAELSFTARLPRWEESVRAAGCGQSEIRGKVCHASSPCRPCAAVRGAHATALATEQALWHALREAIRAALPDHGGWWEIALEPRAGIDGPISVRVTAFVPAVAVGAAAAPSRLATDMQAVEAELARAFEAALDRVGGVSEGAIARLHTERSGLVAALQALYRPLPLRLAALAEAKPPAPGSVARWARAWALTAPTSAGKQRRVSRSGVWGAFAGAALARTLRALALRNDEPQQVPVRTTMLDRYRIVDRGTHTVTLQSYNSGELVAVRRGDLSEIDVDSRSNPTTQKLGRWVRDTEPKFSGVLIHNVHHVSVENQTDNAGSLSLLSDLIVDSTHPSAEMPSPEEQEREMAAACLRRGMFGWEAVEWQEAPERPGTVDDSVRPPGWLRSYGSRRVAKMSSALLAYWIQRSRAGWAIWTQVNNVAGVKTDSGAVVSRQWDRIPTDYAHLTFDVDAQKILPSGELGLAPDQVAAQLEAWGAEVDHIVASGSGGAHVVVRLDAPGEIGLTYSVFKRAVRAFDNHAVVDNTYAVGHCFRLPGTFNWKSGEPRFVRVAWARPEIGAARLDALVAGMDAADVPALPASYRGAGPAPGPRLEPLPADAQIIAEFPDSLRPYVTGELRIDRDGNNSHAKCFGIAAHLHRQGFTVDEAIAFVSRNACATLHRYREKGVDADVRSCYRALERK